MAILRMLTIIAWIFMLSSSAAAQISTPASFEAYKQDVERRARQEIEMILAKYCQGACEVIDIRAGIEESMPDVEELGFEGVAPSAPRTNIFASRLGIELQIDDQVTEVNRGRLRAIIVNRLRSLATQVEVVWNPVRLPHIGEQTGAEELQNAVVDDLTRRLQRVIDKYCPDDCLLTNVAVEGRLITPDEANGLSNKEVHRGSHGILRITSARAELSINEDLPEGRRNKIASMLRAKGKHLAAFELDVISIPFPETHSEAERKKNQESEDPFGLEKLRRMLVLFRELAGTKEIITNATTQRESLERSENSNTNSSTSQSTESSSLSRESKELQSNSTNSQSQLTATATESSQSSATNTLEYALYIGGFLLLAGILVALIMRFASASRDAKVLMAAAPQQQGAAGEGVIAGARAGGVGVAPGGISAYPGALRGAHSDPSLQLKLRIESVRDELVRVFVDQPRVAKETFSRLLLEEGVETTSKYVHILGQVVVFELVEDPNVQRELYALSEYYHKSQLKFTLEEELDLLLALKTKVLACEIKVLTRKRMEKFDFLAPFDAHQVYNLIQDEKSNIQAIVLTQLDQKRRQRVFEFFEGDSRVKLLQALCRGDAVPKEFLSNVASALHKKVAKRPEFDTENIRSNDILLDLLEKANLADQRGLMSNLQKTNAEAARAIKAKLVTLEMLPYLKDGLLLELILGIERVELLQFLLGTREAIRNLFLAKAPRELAESWMEDIEAMAGVDDATYRLTELKILDRIRAFANSGAINLLDINNMIFSGQSEDRSDERVSDRPEIGRENLVA